MGGCISQVIPDALEGLAQSLLGIELLDHQGRAAWRLGRPRQGRSAPTGGGAGEEQLAFAGGAGERGGALGLRSRFVEAAGPGGPGAAHGPREVIVREE